MSHYISDPTAAAAIGAITREERILAKTAGRIKAKREQNMLGPKELLQARRLFSGIFRPLLDQALGIEKNDPPLFRSKRFPALIVSDCVEQGAFSHLRQVSQTLGLYRCGHPEIESLVSFRKNGEIVSLAELAARRVSSDGKHYDVGDLEEFSLAHGRTIRVCFLESANAYGPCLRAVALGMDSAFQVLPQRIAAQRIEKAPGAFSQY